MKYLRRLMTFLASRMVIITLCAALLVTAFYMAFNMGSAYILVTEGFEKRVDVCLTRQEYTELNKYFSVGFLTNDPVLAASVSLESPYIPYNITGYDYDIKVEKLKAWPWDDNISCIITEYVTNITGTVKNGYTDVASINPPAWRSGRYYVGLERQGGKWVIGAIVQDDNYRDPTAS